MNNIIFVNSVNVGYNPKDIPIGILSLATILKKRNYNVELIDFNYLFHENIIIKEKEYDKNLTNMCDYILRSNPSIVGFYTMCNSYHTSIMLAKKLKEINPNIKILFGGPQASLTAEETMRQFPWVDVIGIGECEANIEYIINSLCTSGNFTNIPGVAYRKEGKVILNNNLDLIIDLDSLPIIDYSFVNMKNIKEINLDVGRGCPFGCTYCSTKTFWKRHFRLKSAKRILEEIRYLIDKYSIRSFGFVHDLFTANKSKVIEFCDLILKEELDIKWTCSARIDTLDEEVISKMAKSGCNAMYLGIESGSKRMQKVINKNLELSNLSQVVDILKKYKIEITTSFIYGFPDEKIEDIEDTLNLIRILNDKKVNHIQLHLLAILPGTEMFENVKESLEFSKNYSDICNVFDESEYVNSLIKNNPKIFPQYFELKTDIRERLTYLDKFVYHIYPIFFKHLQSTYRLLMKYYNNSLYRLFLEFKDKNIPQLSETSFIETITKKNGIFRNIKLIEKYIYCSNFGEKTNLIIEVFKFELNIFQFLYEESQDEQIIDYNIDVYKIKRLGFSSERDVTYPVKIKFTRISKNDINVKRIA